MTRVLEALAHDRQERGALDFPGIAHLRRILGRILTLLFARTGFMR